MPRRVFLPSPASPGPSTVVATHHHISHRLALALAFAPALTAGLALLSAGGAFAQAIDGNLWVTNGTVNAVVRDGNTLYIGGAFTLVGPVTGGGVPIDASSGAPESGFPKVEGYVSAVVPDGAGGWYIGGGFTAVGGIPRANIAHILADKSVSGWSPGANSEVSALAVSGGLVYAGGYFGTIGGQTRSHIAALDAATGLATAWNPNANSNVYALVASGGKVYAGGEFSTIGGQARSCIAALDTATGAATTWNPNARAPSSPMVGALAVSGTTVYAAGWFDSIGGLPRNNAAGLNITTGLANGWNPNANAAVNVLVVSGTTVYAGGGFTSIGGQTRNRIAALNTTTGSATAWNPDASSLVLALAVSGTTVYAGGEFASIGGQTRSRIAALDATTGLATAWSPNADNRVLALAASGGTVYAGGWFTSIGRQARNNIAALDATTGAATAWNPNANNWVYALAVSGTTVYAGGYFTSIGGQTRNRIAALDATTGTATAWDPNASGHGGSSVLALAVSGNTVYAGGYFTSVGGQTRNNIAALDATTGAATAWNPNAHDGDFPYVNALAVSGNTVYAGGCFTSIGGQTRNYIAALDTASGLATPWNPNANNWVYALAVSGSMVYAGGYFTSIGGQARNYVAALDTTTGLATAWNPNANGNVYALAASGGTVYAGGDFTSMSVQPRAHVAAIVAQPWLTGVQPTRGGNTGPVTLTVRGQDLRPGAMVRLVHGEVGDISGSGVIVAPDGSSLTATFDLTGATPGLWDVEVTNFDLQTATLSNGFTIEVLLAPQLRVDVVGPGVIRANHPTAFDLMVANAGNVDAVTVPLWLFGVPSDATVALDFPLASPPRAGGEPDWSTVPLTLGNPGEQYLALVIPRVPPGVVTRRVILTVPASDTAFALGAALTPPWVDGAGLGICLVGAGVIGNPGCMGAQLSAMNDSLLSTPGIPALNGIGAWAKITWQCEGAGSLPAAVAKAELVLDYLEQVVKQETAPPGCGDVLLPRWRDSLVVAVVTSIDPNDKLGVVGYGPTRLISGQQALPYSVRFENDATASAPVQELVVMDVLNVATLDVNTVSLETITFGNVHVYPQPGQSSYATEVDLRPALDLKVQVSASLDPYTGALSWYFKSIDPATGQPPLNPLVGFLPPNVVPPEGEGSVLFTVRPQPALSTGTEIRNAAAIMFDDPPAYDTGDWLNTVDNTAPGSHVVALAPNQDSVRFTVRWVAEGAPTDLRDYTIYAAEDAGAYRAWRQNTVATADTFASRYGHTYSFYSVARDQSGNVEAAPAGPDAVTYARWAGVEEPAVWQLALGGARPNPTRGAIQAWFTLPGRERATLEVLDVAGRRVERREVGSLGAGPHVMTLGGGRAMRPGLYFLRLAQGGRVLHARVALIR